MTSEAIKHEALTRARDGESEANVPAIIAGFIARGIPESDIRPRENVFTFNAWLAIGRSVRKGEHGVKVHTWIEREENGEKTRFPRSTTVFHITPGMRFPPALSSNPAPMLPHASWLSTKEGKTNMEQKLFYVHGWGETGEANMYAFVPFAGKKNYRDLEVNETTEGRFTNPTSDKKPERITRIR